MSVAVSTDSPATAVTQRIHSIGFLRCIASALVVLYHIDLQLYRLSNGAQPAIAGFGAAGTDMLFVISGFILVYISRGKADRPGKFLLERVIRVVPLYWLFTLLMLGIFVAAPGMFKSTAFAPAHFLASLALIPYPHPVLGVDRPFLVAGWSLSYFFLFYLLFSAFLFLPVGRRITAVASILGFFVLVASFTAAENRLLAFYGAPFVLDFVVGMVAGWIYLSQNRIRRALLMVAFLASALTFAAGAWHGVPSGGFERFGFWALSDGGFMLVAVFIEKQWGWWNTVVIEELGNASFATYLSHTFTLGILTKLIEKSGLFPVVGPTCIQSLLLGGALAGGLTVHHLIEKPLHAFALRQTRRTTNMGREARMAPAK